MFVRNIFLILFLVYFQITQSKYGFGGDQEWGFVTVRPGANMFYWLYYTTANVSSYSEKPLIIWLEGGPGISSTGYTNFKEIGPLTLNLTSRSESLVKDYNILFIDSPVGTGFSYTNSEDNLAKTEKQVALDLVSFIEQFFKEFPSLTEVATYIVGQCYGGKSAVLFAYEWIQKIESGWNVTNLKGIGLSNSWISPIDSVLTWAPYLYNNGLVDTKGYKAIMRFAKETKSSVDIKDWITAEIHLQSTIRAIRNFTVNVNFYNIFSKVNYQNRDEYVEDEEAVKNLMESKVKAALNLSEDRYFNVDIKSIYLSLTRKLMKPVTKKVEYLLNQTKFKVFVFNGQFDLLVDTPGTLHWVENLKWKNSSEWLAANRTSLMINNFIEGYKKEYGNLRMYWVNRAGHVITVGNPAASRKILQELTSDNFSD